VQDYDRHGEQDKADELLGVLYEDQLEQEDAELAARIEAKRGGWQHE